MHKMIYKKTAIIFTAMTMLVMIIFSMPASLSAHEGNIKVFVDREELELDMPPVLLNDQLLIPMHPVLDAFKTEINWNNEGGIVFVEWKGKKGMLIVGKSFAWINEKYIELDAPVTVVQGCTMIPIGFLADFFEAKVFRDVEQKTVEIESSDFIPFERPAQDMALLPLQVRKWAEISWSKPNIRVEKVEGKVYIFVTYGLKNTGGYSVEIKRIERTRNSIVIVADFSAPLDEYYTIPVLSHPYDLISMDSAQVGDSACLICLAKGLKEGELPIKVEF